MAEHIQISGFEILGRLGQGGMATVWQARQISLDRVVAIKILSQHMAHDAADVDRFQQEARSAAKLKHPGIIQVYDANVENGLYYFVMEYISGYSMATRIRSKTRLSTEEALLVAEHVANALAYAWDAERVIHCDIKPDNVMVDADGTIKVADLGLARTISSMSVEDAGDEILGTPTYMSPEQAMGIPDLDCRTDIYSLGAMLYHMVTGRMLFEGQDAEAVMEAQVNAADTDAFEINPELSRGVCWLIEKMLAKDRDRRPADWHEVIRDLHRAARNQAPVTGVPEEGQSTMARCEARRASEQMQQYVHSKAMANLQDDGKRSRLPWVVGIGMAAAAAIAIGFHVVNKPPAAMPPTPASEAPAVSDPAEGATDGRDAEAKAAFDEARQWARGNPDNYREAVARFQSVAREYDGSRHAARARQEVRRLQALEAEAIQRVVRELSSKAAPLKTAGKYGEAVALFEQYRGPLAEASRMARSMAAEEVRREESEHREAERQAAAAQQAALKQLADSVAATLLKDGVEFALQSLRDARKGGRYTDDDGTLDGMADVMSNALQTDETLLASFRRDIGREVTVSLRKGRGTLTLIRVEGTRITGEQKINVGTHVATREISFDLADLSPEERFSRIGGDREPPVALLKGLTAWNGQLFEPARGFFSGVPGLLGEALVRQCEARIQASRPAKTVKAESPEPAEPAPEPRPEPVQPAEPAPVVRDASTLSALEVSQRLIAANPELLMSQINIEESNGQPVRAEIVSPSLRRIEALGALGSLEELALGAAPYRRREYREPAAPLSDLSPIGRLKLSALRLAALTIRDLGPVAGMPLQELVVQNCPLTGIEPIAQLPLKRLTLRGTRVKDISAIRGMRLESLDLSDMSVFDFRVIAGMPLQQLDVSDTQFRDLSVLDGMPLKVLNAGRTRIMDFGPLRGMQPVVLNLAGTQLRDASVLSHMPLRSLDISDTSVTDIAPLAGLKLRHFSMVKVGARDFQVLAGMPLEDLNLCGTRIIDLSVLSGLKLRSLDVSDTNVRDLSALVGLPLRHLNISKTDVKSLAPLAGLPLDTLVCTENRFDSLSPLSGSSIQVLWIDHPENPAVRQVLRTMPNLRRVNGVDWIN